jgi:hypothetical protein
MKWKKMGRIFNPVDYKLSNNCVEFSQSPQTLVFDDFVRIYFSTRERDQKGKFLSHISFVEVDKKFKQILRVSANTVLPLGKKGCFDEHGIFPLNILKDKDKILGYICGWSRRVSVSVETAIGLAESYDDGLTFKRIGDGPILTASLNEPFLVGDPFVRVYNGIYHMWYIFGTNWVKHSSQEAPDRVYKIGHASSADGVSWIKDGQRLIDDKLNSNECQALPTVIWFDGKYHLFFCYREAIGFRRNRESTYRIGYAHSQDLVNWRRDDESAGIELSDDGWDSGMMCYPHVFQCEDNIYMLYNGDEFGRYGFGLAVLES